MADFALVMTLKKNVLKVVYFGTFIDIGIKQDGLPRHTQIPFGTMLRVGDILVWRSKRTNPSAFASAQGG